MNVKNENNDTSPESDAVLNQLIMHQEPAKRLAAAVAASNRVAGQCKDAIRRANPGISIQEVNLRFIELNYGAELAAAVRSVLAIKQ
jgi:hypothetical protein